MSVFAKLSRNDFFLNIESLKNNVFITGSFGGVKSLPIPKSYKSLEATGKL